MKYKMKYRETGNLEHVAVMSKLEITVKIDSVSTASLAVQLARPKGQVQRSR